MASATATHQPLRVVSRRARLLLERHRAKKNGGQSPSPGASSKSAPKQDDTSWPKSLRYTFYTVCVASVPFSIGQAIALSPRLREWMVGDDVVEDDDGSLSDGGGGGGFSSREIISLVRKYWGHEDYVAPIDRPQLRHVTPGHKNEWQEDNYSSLLELFGLYTPKHNEAPDNTISEEQVPMSLDNEPPAIIRHDQNILAQYLSTKTNPAGVKTRLTLIPCKDSMEGGMGSDIDDMAGYETECTLPANISMETLRALCQGSDAQSLRRDLVESDPGFLSKTTNERIRTKSWNEDCRWVVSFPDSEEEDSAGVDANDAVAQIMVLGGGAFDSPQENQSVIQTAAKFLRHNTAIHSSWTYFPESAINTPTASPLGSTGNATAEASSSTSTTSTMTNTSTNSLQIQRLQHQIATLEQELKDPSSLRDRDSMYDELKLAKRELRGLKPWWRRFWG